MNLFEAVQKNASIIGFYPIENEKDLLNQRIIGFLLLFGMLIACEIVYILFDVHTIQEYELAFIVLISALFVFAGSVSFAVKLCRLTKLIKRTGVIIQKQLHDPISKSLYTEANETIKIWSKGLHVIMITSLLTAFIPFGFVSYYQYFVMKLGSDAFIIPIFMKIPFNWKTPIGFAIAGALQAIFAVGMLYSALCALSVLIGFFWFGVSFAKNIQMKIFLLKHQFRIQKDAAKLKIELRDIIDLHSEFKELAAEFTNGTEFNVSGYYVWSMLAICNSLLMCYTAENTVGFIISMGLAFYSFAQIFLFCEFGERLTRQFNRIDSEFFKSNWYTFPIEVQKILPIILNGTQHPVLLMGIGGLICTRETFKNVSTSGYSKFAIIRHLIRDYTLQNISDVS